jgi:cysteine desulfurase family protein (TIGR01976 family)
MGYRLVMFDVEAARAQFPALSQTVGGFPVAYLDGPGGTQVPAPVIEAMRRPLASGISNLGGPFPSSELAEEITHEARRAGADLVGASTADEIVFGQNMTSLTFSMSRALSRTWRAGDRIVVTSLDHDANVSPWRLAAADVGVAVDVARFDSSTYRLEPEAVASLLTDRTRLVAVTHASNALGTIPDVADIAAAAHSVGALVYVDAVHFAPHGVIDVQGIGADFLVVSAYKFHGPHTGMLFGRHDLLEDLEAYKVRPAPSSGPGKWETGTQSFESLAGLRAAIDYLASLGSGQDRRQQIIEAHRRVDQHVGGLMEQFLSGLGEHVTLHGVRSPEARTPTFAVTLAGIEPAETATRLAEQGLLVWDGHYYAIEPMSQLGLLTSGGAVRIGFVHTTTADEVERLLAALDSFRH